MFKQVAIVLFTLTESINKLDYRYTLIQSETKPDLKKGKLVYANPETKTWLYKLW